MATLRALDCLTCRRGSSNYEDKYNKKERDQREKAGWWFCSNARTPVIVDRHGEVLCPGKPCETNYCPECGPRNVARYEAGLHYANPTLFVTVNEVAANHEIGRARMTKFRRLCDQWGYRFENAYTFERYVERDRSGLHVHLLGHGYGHLPSQEVLEHAAERAGFDPCRVGQRVNRQTVVHHSNVGYLLKTAKDPSTRFTFLYDNGGRLMSTTRGFWKTPQGQVPRGGIKGFLRAVEAER